MFSIVIPTCNRPDLLKKCLDALHPSIQQVGFDYELIVSDDSQDEETKLFIEKEYEWVKWVEGPKKGPAANRNNGVKFSNHEWLIFIDDDCIPNKDIVKQYYQAILVNKTIKAFEGRIYVNEPQTSFLQESPINEKGGYFWSCNICINKELFNELNGFDENFPYAAMEDVDFFYRLKKTTDKYSFTYHAAVEHPWKENNDLISTTFKRYYSRVYYTNKHPIERKRFTFKQCLIKCIKSLFTTYKKIPMIGFKGILVKTLSTLLLIYFAFRTLIRVDQKNTYC